MGTRMLHPPLRRHPALVALAAGCLVAASGLFATSASAVTAPTFTHTLNCQTETHPPTDEPRNGATTPYQAPFTATLNGGHVTVANPSAPLGIELGPPQAGDPDGTLFGNSCGLVTLPSLVGPISGNPYGALAGTPNPNPDFNNNFILHGPQGGTATCPAGTNSLEDTPIPVALVIVATGVTVGGLCGTGSADGAINARILPTPAANGGFNISFTTTAKATATLTLAAATQLLPVLLQLGISTTILQELETALTTAPPTGAECTLSLGDQAVTGLPAGEVGNNTTPVTLSTAAAGGLPITGPVTDGSGVAVGSDLNQPAISPNMPADPAASGATTTAPSTLCSPALAGLLNGLFGLGTTPNTYDTFVAPVSFAANVPADG